jgi:2-haloalkanoic acid dehalogenase type II
MANFKAVIFDYYETLGQLHYDERELLFDDIARDVGVELEAGEAYKVWTEKTTGDLKLRFGGTRPEPSGEPFPFRTFWDVWRERFAELFQGWGVDAAGDVGADGYTNLHIESEVYPEVVETLEELGKTCRVAILSNADDAFLHGSVARNGLQLEAVISSEELKSYKPHASIFHQMCERMAIEPSDVLYVGDQPWADVEGSRHAGMGQAWINRHAADWPDDVAPPQHELASLTDLISIVS